MRVPDMLKEAAETYEKRNDKYGDNYKKFGLLMAALFPKGIQCNTVADHNRLGIITQIAGKLGRYCDNFDSGGHDDSLLDISAYAAMLRELDEIERNKPEVPF